MSIASRTFQAPLDQTCQPGLRGYLPSPHPSDRIPSGNAGFWEREARDEGRGPVKDCRREQWTAPRHLRDEEPPSRSTKSGSGRWENNSPPTPSDTRLANELTEIFSLELLNLIARP